MPKQVRVKGFLRKVPGSRRKVRVKGQLRRLPMKKRSTRRTVRPRRNPRRLVGKIKPRVRRAIRRGVGV